MAKFDSKSFNPQAFKYKADRIPRTRLDELRKSRVLAPNPDVKNVFSTQDGTGYARLAMRGLLDGDAVNYDGQTDITATSTKTFEQGVVIVGRAKAWVEKDFSYDITGGVDFMDNVAQQVADYWQDVDEDTILAILEGIFSMSGETKSAEFVEKHTYTTGDAMGATTLNSAIAKACGDRKKKFSLVFMHSTVATNLENLNLLKHLTYTDKDGVTRDLTLYTWNGKTVIVDDHMPVVSGYYACQSTDTGALKVVASGATAGQVNLTDVQDAAFAPTGVKANDYVVLDSRYTTFVLGEGSIGYEDIGAKVPYEMDRNPAKNGGEDTLYTRQRKAFVPYGISYEKVSQASLSPTDAELKNGANWALVHSGESSESARTYINEKVIPIARIFSRA